MGNKAPRVHHENARKARRKSLQDPSTHMSSAFEGNDFTVTPDDPKFDVGVNCRNGQVFKHIYKRSKGPFLDEGQFGVVYRCEHMSAREDDVPWKYCALKVTSPNLLDHRRLGGRMFETLEDVEENCQELHCLMLLRGVPYHRNILQLQEYFFQASPSQELRLVTELLGPNLREWMAEEPYFSENQAREVASVLSKAVIYMHSRGVIHRDIKADNVMFQRADDLNSLKIVDFGFAKELKKGEEVNEFCGSPGYIPPEMYMREPYKLEPDIFSLGVLLFRIISAEEPWPCNPPEETKRATTQLQYRINAEKWKGVSQKGKDLIANLLAYKEDRLTADEVSSHPWLVEDTDTVLRNVTPVRIDPTKAFSLVSASSTQSESTLMTRFWIDREMHEALLDIPRSVYRGRIVMSELDHFLIDESLPKDSCVLNRYVARLPAYTEDDCRNICRQIALHVQTLHKAGIAHRNLYLENIVVQSEVLQGDPVISVRGMKYALKKHDNEPMTGKVGMKGKKRGHYPYVAPEIDSSFSHDERVDLWSLGAIIYTLLCGVAPFRSREARDKARFEFDLAQPSSSAVSLVKSLLVANPAKRPSITEVLDHEWMDRDDLEEMNLDLAKEIFVDYGQRARESALFRTS